ncbi:MAG: hypothetical protein JW787_18145 [Sedimentisphaerales bacterium]|nr:hypothetical protein [Sedimentisphaerales bacterium]
MSKTKSKKDNICKSSESSYVAFDPVKGSSDIIACDSNVGKVIDLARKQGIDVPAIMFVPEEGVTYIY